MKALFYIFMLLFAYLGNAQDQSIRLVSKFDVNPQYLLADGSEVRLMGFTQQLGETIEIPSPTITVYEGDSVELSLWNFSQGAPHTIHLHGLDVNQENDGVPHLSFVVKHSEEKAYRFRAPQPGTYLYHCHVISPIHVQGGMYGLFIVKPKGLYNTTWEGGYEYDAEASLLMSELDKDWHTYEMLREHANEDGELLMKIPKYVPEYFLVNGKSDGQLRVLDQQLKMYKQGHFYLRLANIGNYGNRIVIPENLDASIISSDGRPLPVEEKTNVIEVMPGERYGVLIETVDSLIDSIQIEYFNLNTQEVENVQTVYVSVLDTINGIQSIPIDINIYPNPVVDGRLYIVNSTYIKAEYELFSITGELLKKDLLNQPYIDLADLNKGYYFLRLYIDQEVLNQKIIIEN